MIILAAEVPVFFLLQASATYIFLPLSGRFWTLDLLNQSFKCWTCEPTQPEHNLYVMGSFILIAWMEQHALKNVNNCLNTNIYSYLETSGGQSYTLYLNVVHF